MKYIVKKVWGLTPTPIFYLEISSVTTMYLIFIDHIKAESIKLFFACSFSFSVIFFDILRIINNIYQMIRFIFDCCHSLTINTR